MSKHQGLSDSVVVYTFIFGAPFVCVGSCVGPCFVVSSSVLSNFAIILLRKRELAALLQKCSCCHVAISVLRLLLAVLWVGLPGHTHSLGTY